MCARFGIVLIKSLSVCGYCDELVGVRYIYGVLLFIAVLH